MGDSWLSVQIVSASRSNPWPIVIADAVELQQWIEHSPAGATVSWHRGDLAADRRQHCPVDELARAVARMVRTGKVRAFAVEGAGSTVHRLTRVYEPLGPKERRQCRIAPPR